MENFFLDEVFYNSLEELIQYLEEDEDIENFAEDWSIKVELGNLEPMFQVDADDMLDILLDANEYRLGEDIDDKRNVLLKIFKENCNFEKINNSIPKYYYPTNKFEILTKKDLMEYYNSK